MTPTKPKFVAYYRVSTERQGRSGLGLDAQRESVERFLTAQGGVLAATFREVESGKVNARPQLEAALLRCRAIRGTLLVAKLDRLSRDAGFLMSLRNGDVKFQALDLPEANTLTLGVMAAMAQHERETISARTRAALAARKARGQALGTPRDMSAYQAAASRAGNAVKAGKADDFAQNIMPMIEEAKADGAGTLREIAEHLNDAGATTSRGSQWTAAAVQRVMGRASMTA
jgi:DNA invertase Pin-like site-specific DNA recombinase